MKHTQKQFTLAAILMLTACSDSGSRYSISNDIGPDEPILLDHIEDAHPRYEPFSRGGNRDYSLRGHSYQIIKNPQGFKQAGEASWYGKKFHGHLTSNGEIYDMYSMSAAHKTLPIPSYVKVTNKDNNTSTIVRVNDRGPFHENRIIDLSYAAAYKLGIVNTGIANVEIEYITVDSSKAQQKEAKTHPRYIIQAALSSHEQRSQTVAQKIHQTLEIETYVEQRGEHFLVLVGPYANYFETDEVLQKLKSNGYPQSFIRKNSH